MNTICFSFVSCSAVLCLSWPPSSRQPQLASCAPAPSLVQLRLCSRQPPFGFESDNRPLAHIVATFGIHCSFGPTTQRACVERSHRAAATVLAHAERRKRRGEGQQGMTRDRASTVQYIAVLLPWVIMSARS